MSQQGPSNMWQPPKSGKGPSAVGHAFGPQPGPQPKPKKAKQLVVDMPTYIRLVPVLSMENVQLQVKDVYITSVSELQYSLSQSTSSPCDVQVLTSESILCPDSTGGGPQSHNRSRRKPLH